MQSKLSGSLRLFDFEQLSKSMIVIVECILLLISLLMLSFGVGVANEGGCCEPLENLLQLTFKNVDEDFGVTIYFFENHLYVIFHLFGIIL